MRSPVPARRRRSATAPTASPVLNRATEARNALPSASTRSKTAIRRSASARRGSPPLEELAQEEAHAQGDEHPGERVLLHPALDGLHGILPGMPYAIEQGADFLHHAVGALIEPVARRAGAAPRQVLERTSQVPEVLAKPREVVLQGIQVHSQ